MEFLIYSEHKYKEKSLKTCEMRECIYRPLFRGTAFLEGFLPDTEP